MIDLTAPNEFDDLDFDSLKTTCMSCTRCGLSEGRTNVVFGTGPAPCDVMVIGEGPGEQEDLSGKPFVGRAGKLLDKIFESVGISRDSDVFIANTVKCRPPQNRTPLPTEISACYPYLQRQIQLLQPKILILLGSPSLKTILDATLTITKARGQWFKADVPYMDDPLYIMPMFHPSYLLRQSSKEKGSPKWLTWQDMREVKSAMDFYRQS